jgi:hypothetical protein
MALGKRNFRLSSRFISQLDAVLETNIPKNAFAAMDYHLDCLFASLQLTSDGLGEITREASTDEISGSSQDIDFLIAYPEKGICHLILVEAKGVGEWDYGQMNSKANRFSAIFGKTGKRFPFAVPHFITVSPRPPGLATTSWPSWMKRNGKPNFVELEINPGLKRIAQTDKQGDSNMRGGHWAIKSDRY